MAALGFQDKIQMLSHTRPMPFQFLPFQGNDRLYSHVDRLDGHGSVALVLSVVPHDHQLEYPSQHPSMEYLWGYH